MNNKQSTNAVVYLLPPSNNNECLADMSLQNIWYTIMLQLPHFNNPPQLLVKRITVVAWQKCSVNYLMHILNDDKFGNLNNFCKNGKQILKQEHSLFAGFSFSKFTEDVSISISKGPLPHRIEMLWSCKCFHMCVNIAKI